MNNRQARGRGRGRNNNNNNRNNNRGGGGIDRDNRIDNRARGNAAQMLDKYKKMAHDAQVNDDRVNAEYYLQFADHYFRVNADMQARREEQRIAREEARGNNDDRGERNDRGDDSNNDRQSRPPRNNSNQQRNNRDDDRGQNAQANNQSEDEVAEKKPVRARRPRKVAEKAENGANGDASGMQEEPKGLDAGVLPPAISVSADSDADEVKVEKKPARKKRVVKPKATEEGDAA